MTSSSSRRGPRSTTAGPVPLRRLLPVLLAGLLVLLAPATAWAHGGRVPEPVVTSVPDGVEGLRVEGLVTVGPQLLLRNPSDVPLEVLDDQGTPFLRISSAGVEADLSVRAWWEANDPTGRGQDPPPDAPTGWTQVSVDDAFGWFDNRLIEAAAPDADHSWSIDVLVDGRPDRIEGESVESDLVGTWSAALEGDGSVGSSQVTAVSGPVPALVVQRRDAEEVVVVGSGGEPMLRLTAAGVEANLASPSWHDHARFDTATPDPDVVADASAEPVWEQQSQAPTVAWLESRAASLRPVPGSADETELAWSVPLLVDGERYEVVGATTWVGDAPPGPLDALLRPRTLLLVLAAGLLAWAGVQHRRERDERDEDDGTDADDMPDVGGGGAAVGGVPASTDP